MTATKKSYLARLALMTAASILLGVDDSRNYLTGTDDSRNYLTWH
jgi:hypothetical protein